MNISPLMRKLSVVGSIAFFLTGLISRLAPLANQEGRLFWQFVTEDGYLLITIARNMALGNGMSTSDGTILTNGVQPLATFLFSAIFYVVDGDKQAGIVGILIFSTLVSLVSAWLIYRLCKLLFDDPVKAHVIGILTAALWFASPTILRHTVNYLETGVYLAVILVLIYSYLLIISHDEKPLSTFKIVLFGVGLGLLFLARNDAVLLILAFCVYHVLRAYWERQGQPSILIRAVKETLIFGSVSVIVAAPWLLYNLSIFNHLMPISGISESLAVGFAQNLSTLPKVILEYVLVVFPVPEKIEHHILILIIGTITGIGLVIVLRKIYQTSNQEQKAVIFIMSVFILLLAVFYGLFFGAPYFLSRYLAPASPFLAIMGVSFAVWGVNKFSATWPKAIILISAAAIILTAGLNAYLYRRGTNNGHRQVIEWVKKNVADDVWVAAIQTGTLGFHHDRTHNLDGKVNPEALRVRIDNDGDVYPYVIKKKEIQYIADWAQIADWVRIPSLKFASNFDLLLVDEKSNIAILQRRKD